MKNLLITFAIMICSISHGQRKTDWNTQDNCKHTKVTRYESGQIREVGCFNAELKMTGTWYAYARNGNRIGQASFDSEGNKHGAWKVWDIEGSLKAEMYYEHGKRIGTWKAYHTDGTVETKNYDL